MLRLLLGRYLELDPARLSFVSLPLGKPALVAELGRDSLRFNVAHSNELVLYAVTRDLEVGVDLEHVRPLAGMEKIAERFFSARECAVLGSISPEPEGNSLLHVLDTKRSVPEGHWRRTVSSP